MSSSQSPTTILNRTFISIFFTNMALNLGMNMSNSLLALYANSMGASESVIGLIMGTFVISSVVFRFISAPIMDTYNRKYVITFATLMLALVFFGFSISKTVPMLLGFRLVQGCGMAFGNACCLAMAAEALPKDKYTSGIGYYSLAQVICQAVGPSAGLAIMDWFGFSAAYVINACVMLVAAFLAVTIKNSFIRVKKLKFSFGNVIAKEALLPTFLFFMISLAVAPQSSFLIIFAGNQGVTSNIGLYFTVSAITLLATRPIVGRLIDKYGLVKVAIPALVCTIGAYFLISASTTLISFLFASFISAFGHGACTPAIQALSMKAVTNERRGAASSTNYIGMDTGHFVGSMISGGIAQSLGYVPMWRIMPVFLLFAITVIVVFRKKVTSIEENFKV